MAVPVKFDFFCQIFRVKSPYSVFLAVKLVNVWKTAISCKIISGFAFNCNFKYQKEKSHIQIENVSMLLSKSNV